MEVVKQFEREVYPKYHPIPGWLDITEAFALFAAARELPGSWPTVVEIGSWRGKSAVVMALGMLDKYRAKVYCVDPFVLPDAPQYAFAADIDLFHSFTHNVNHAMVGHIVEPIKGYSVDVARTWAKHFQEHPIDLLFIDGDHSHAAVLADLKAWVPLLKPGGILAMHDINEDGPCCAAADYFGLTAIEDELVIDKLFITRVN